MINNMRDTLILCMKSISNITEALTNCFVPFQTQRHTVCLQPFLFDPNEKNKHKFMVQSVVAPVEDIPHEDFVGLIMFFIYKLNNNKVEFVCACSGRPYRPIR